MEALLPLGIFLASIDLSEHRADARSIVTALAEAGHRWTEYRVNGKPVLELACPCKDADELPRSAQPGPAVSRGT